MVSYRPVLAGQLWELPSHHEEDPPGVFPHVGPQRRPLQVHQGRDGGRNWALDKSLPIGLLLQVDPSPAPMRNDPLVEVPVVDPEINPEIDLFDGSFN